MYDLPSGWLTGNKIIEEVSNGEIKIEPFDINCINSNSYNFHLSDKLLIMTNQVIDCFKPDDFKEILLPSKGYTLMPENCYLGSTVEKIGSFKYASLITGRSSIGRKFITNHITAGLIDQGFLGHITLEITVKKPTIIYPNMSFGQIFWFCTYGTPLLYQGKYQEQNEPTGSKLNWILDIT